MARVFLGIGSNLFPESNVFVAVRRLAAALPVTGVSTFHRTAAEGRAGQADFVNGVLAVEADEPPLALRRKLRALEASLGRTRSADKNADRPIDLDLLLYGDLRSSTPPLPHPDIARHAHLAVPLAELAPYLTLPGTRRTLADVAGRFAGHAMTPLPELTEVLRRACGLEDSFIAFDR